MDKKSKLDASLGPPEDHPAYGMISIHRTFGNQGQSLVGCTVRNNHTVRIRVSQAEKRRSLSDDRFYARERLIELDLSPSQFAELIISMNTEGVPCTLRYLRSNDKIPNPPFDDKREQFVEEFRQHIAELGQRFDSLQAQIDALREKPSVTKADRAALANAVRMLRQQIDSNIPFVLSQWNEQLANTLVEAKHEFEAYVTARMQAIAERGLGLEHEETPPLISLE